MEQTKDTKGHPKPEGSGCAVQGWIGFDIYTGPAAKASVTKFNSLRDSHVEFSMLACDPVPEIVHFVGFCPSKQLVPSLRERLSCMSRKPRPVPAPVATC